jgi:hypothetical protein
MPKFQKPNIYPRPLERAVPLIAEQPEVPEEQEQAVIDPSEKPMADPSQVCGIGGCQTWYEDPVVMKRHYERQHGIGGPPDMNQPKERDQNSLGDPVLKAMQRER